MRAPGDTVTIVPVENEDIMTAVEAEFMRNRTEQVQQQTSTDMTPYIVGGAVTAAVLVLVYALTR